MTDIDFTNEHITVIGADHVNARLEGIGDRLSDMSEIMSGAIRQTVSRAIQENFHAHGRPDRWPDLAESTRSRKRGGEYPLVDSGMLIRSLTPEGNEYSVSPSDSHSVMVGTTRPGASNHNDGGTVPRRRFMILQDEDIEDVKTIIAAFAIHGKAGVTEPAPAPPLPPSAPVSRSRTRHASATKAATSKRRKATEKQTKRAQRRRKK